MKWPSFSSSMLSVEIGRSTLYIKVGWGFLTGNPYSGFGVGVLVLNGPAITYGPGKGTGLASLSLSLAFSISEYRPPPEMAPPLRRLAASGVL